MRTKEELKVFLDTITDTTIRSLNRKDEGYIFDTQIEAAKEVVTMLACNQSRTNHVILIAKMQSGKTGTCNAIANLIMNTSLKREMAVNKVLYLTGMNDCGLASQTYDRVLQQVTSAETTNTIDKVNNKENNEVSSSFFILKNSNLKTFKGSLNGSLIFIDEAHFGSREFNVLTKFMTSKGIDWKNSNSLIENNIYIVSVSATPFDEIVSDTLECKPMIELRTDDNYIGVSEYFDRECIFSANKDDIKNGIVFDYIKDAYERMKENYERGVVIIRTRDFDQITNNDFVKEKFNVHKMYSDGSKIEYDEFDSLLEELIVENSFQTKIDVRQRKYLLPRKVVKPLLVLIKGAFRAGITIPSRAKDLIYMIYDFSMDASATAQALLGRMCGYRDMEHCAFNTFFYVNTKFAKMYADWEKNFYQKELIPSSRTQWVWMDNDYHEKDTKIGTKPCGNFIVDLDNEDLLNLYRVSKTKGNIERVQKVVDGILKKHHKNVSYDYFGEAYIQGKNNYARSTQVKKFESFAADTIAIMFRPEHNKKFQKDTKRNYLTHEDIGKKEISVSLDAIIYNKRTPQGYTIPQIEGNRRLLVYYYEVGQKKLMANHKTLYKAHKDTALTENFNLLKRN